MRDIEEDNEEEGFFMTLPNGEKVNIKGEDGTSIVDAFVNRKGLKKYIESVDEGHLVVETDDGEFIDTGKVTGKDGIDGKPGKDGKDYILTNEDKKKIAREIQVPIVEKVIEKTEVIKEQPIITNEIKEVAKYETPKEIIKKLESMEGKDRLSAKAIQGLEDYMSYVRVSGASHLYALVDTHIVDPQQGQTLIYNKERSQRENMTGGGIPEAPVDGKTYGRKDATWEEVTSSSSTSFNVFINFVDVDNETIKAQKNMKINSVSQETGSTTILVNGSPYTLGDPIDQYDEIEVTNEVDSLVTFNCEYL